MSIVIVRVWNHGTASIHDFDAFVTVFISKMDISVHLFLFFFIFAFILFYNYIIIIDRCGGRKSRCLVVRESEVGSSNSGSGYCSASVHHGSSGRVPFINGKKLTSKTGKKKLGTIIRKPTKTHVHTISTKQEVKW